MKLLFRPLVMIVRRFRVSAKVAHKIDSESLLKALFSIRKNFETYFQNDNAIAKSQSTF